MDYFWFLGILSMSIGFNQHFLTIFSNTQAKQLLENLIDFLLWIEQLRRAV